MRGDTGEGVLSLGSSQFGAGQESKLPIAAIAMHVVLAGAGPPSACGTTANGRVFLALADASTPSFLEWGANLCEGIVNAELHSHNPWLVEGLEGSSVGVLFRVGGAPDGALRWGLLDPDGGLSHAPVVVGPTAESTVDVGFQPRGVALPGGRVLFTDRRASINVCHALRVMSADGRDAADARWQLPCYSRDRYSAGYRIVPAVELVRAPGGALLVWTEHSDAVARFITASLPWDEGIYATLIGPDGRRASEIVRVTDEAATALDDVPRTETRGPISRDFRFGVDVEGDRAVIAWYDRRRGAAGVYARVLRIRS
ncbi:MAG: hypothetical protein K8H88_26180, partial [Sandaracinaceae bacterium]|nr:hypothetical protein [Sandaracinaceae bacterium]